MTMTRHRHGYCVELQSIRGIAALIVMFRHVAGIYGGGPDWWQSGVWVLNSDAAVGMFFVLSGYVLTGMLQNEPFGLQSHLEFWLRRAFRIYPALVVATWLSLCFAISYQQLHPNIGVWFQHYFTAQRQDLVHILLAFGGLSAHLLPQVWTIAIELCAAAILPSFVWLAAQRRKTFNFVLLGSLIIGVTVGPKTPYSVLLYLPYFLVGVWLAFAPLPICVVLRRLPVCNSLVVVAAIVLIGLRSCVRHDQYHAWLTLEEVGCDAFIISMLVYGNTDLAVLRWPKMTRLGDVSYSLYLLQYVVVFGLATLLVLAQRQIGLTFAPVNLALVTLPIAVAITIPLSAICFRWIETPGNETGKRLVQWLRQRRSKTFIRSNAPGAIPSICTAPSDSSGAGSNAEAVLPRSAHLKSGVALPGMSLERSADWKGLERTL
jgi:peptidoglycan/LPS O-acetylase OafA/YrhL